MISVVLFPQASKPSMNFIKSKNWPVIVKIYVSVHVKVERHGYLNTVRHKLHEHVPSRRWNRIYRQSFGRHLETCRT